MTKEEANKILKYQHDNGNMEEAVRQALAIAIEALQAEYDDYEHATLVDIKEPLKVSVVRCKDCRHQKFYINDKESFHCDKSGVVNMHMEDGDGEFFCKYGERREPENG